MSGRSGARRSFLGRLLLPAPLRGSLVELCRRTTHEGWDRLQAATAAGAGVALVTSASAPWPVAARALAAWAGPLHLALPEDAAGRTLARLLCTGDPESPRLAGDPPSIEAALTGGGRVLFVIAGDVAPDRITLPIPDEARVLPISVEQPGRGRYRLVIGEPPARST